MSALTLADRVRILEQKVGGLSELPARVASVELQISQFREDVRGEFSATRAEIGECEGRLHAEMRSLNQETLTQMRVLHEDVIARIAVLGESANGLKRRKRPSNS